MDAAGVFFDVADAANAVLFGIEGDYVNAGISAAAMVPVLGTVATAGKYTSKGFKTFNKFKKEYGKAGDGMEWHHIVEQRQSRIFPPEMIHNPDNMIKLPVEIHRKISGHYSSKYMNTNMTVRQWLDGKSFEFQYNYGKNVLKLYGY